MIIVDKNIKLLFSFKSFSLIGNANNNESSNELPRLNDATPEQELNPEGTHYNFHKTVEDPSPLNDMVLDKKKELHSSDSHSEAQTPKQIIFHKTKEVNESKVVDGDSQEIMNEAISNKKSDNGKNFNSSKLTKVS